MEEAWEAAELAGIAEDIRRMPMGMHTVISEGQGGISGGQRQRLLIARAIAPKPSIPPAIRVTICLPSDTSGVVSRMGFAILRMGRSCAKTEQRRAV